MYRHETDIKLLISWQESELTHSSKCLTLPLRQKKRLNLIHFLFFSQCNCLLFISIHWISSYRNFLFLFVALCGVFSLLPVLSSTFTFFCYICVKSTLYLGQYNFYTGSSLTVQTSVPNEFQSVRDFFYGVISYN